jgi:hypothetical protein
MPVATGQMVVSPSLVTFTAADPSAPQSVQIRLTNGDGLNVKNGTVSVQVRRDLGNKPWSALVVGVAPVGKALPWAVAADDQSASVTVRTGIDGTVGLLLSLAPDALSDVPPGGIFTILFSTTINRQPKEFTMAVKVVGV